MVTINYHFGPRFRMLHWSTDQIINEALLKMDLTASQGHIMCFLAHSPKPPCSKDLEEHFHLSHPSISGTLSRLEKKGFIELKPDEEDRRCKRIHILPKGLQCHQQILQTVQNIEKQIIQDFTPEEQAQFSAFLERAMSNMNCCSCHSIPKEESKSCSKDC